MLQLRQLHRGVRPHGPQVGMLLVVAFAVLLLFFLPSGFGFRLLARHPAAWSTVRLDHFAPRDIVHVGDLVLAAVMGFFLVTNAARMIRRRPGGFGGPAARAPSGPGLSLKLASPG